MAADLLLVVKKIFRTRFWILKILYRGKILSNLLRHLISSGLIYKHRVDAIDFILELTAAKGVFKKRLLLDGKTETSTGSNRNQAG